MWPRRRFLGLGALTAGAAVTAGCATDQASANGDKTPASIAALDPATLACMHGSSYGGDGPAALRALGETLESIYGD